MFQHTVEIAILTARRGAKLVAPLGSGAGSKRGSYFYALRISEGVHTLDKVIEGARSRGDQ
jgi:hypothetical protein